MSAKDFLHEHSFDSQPRRCYFSPKHHGIRFIEVGECLLILFGYENKGLEELLKGQIAFGYTLEDKVHSITRKFGFSDRRQVIVSFLKASINQKLMELVTLQLGCVQPIAKLGIINEQVIELVFYILQFQIIEAYAKSANLRWLLLTVRQFLAVPKHVLIAHVIVRCKLRLALQRFKMDSESI